jgi:PTS system mannose-specific IIA component
MIAGILFTHGDIGRELLRTAETIIGSQEHVVALSNEGCSATLMEDALTEVLSQEEFSGDVVIFVDLVRGSCWVAVERIRQKYANVHLISGVNLSMLLLFFYKRQCLSLTDLLKSLCQGGIAGIQVRGEAAARPEAGACPG